VSLREAADREDRRGAPARAAAAARATLPRVHPSPLAVLAVAAVLVFAVYLVTSLRPEPQPQREHQPKVVAREAPAAALDQAIEGFGSAWLVDAGAHRLLRMDPATRRVHARIAIPGRVAVNIGPGGLWATQVTGNTFRLVRIDPRTNRVAARIRVPGHPGGIHDFGAPVPVGDGVWVVGPNGVVRVDPATGRPTKELAVAENGYAVRDAAALGGDLWVLVSDGTVHRLDGRTGATRAVLRVPFGRALVPMGGALYLADETQLARMDPATGRLLWRAAIPQIAALASIDGRVWAETPGTSGDRVVAVDPRDGRTVASVQVGEFNATWMGAVGPELWLTTSSGHLVILAP
jgi:outer membrane protein assembly factor BamB